MSEGGKLAVALATGCLDANSPDRPLRDRGPLDEMLREASRRDVEAAAVYLATWVGLLLREPSWAHSDSYAVSWLRLMGETIAERD